MVIPEEAFVNMLYKSSVQLYNFYRRFLCMLHYCQITHIYKKLPGCACGPFASYEAADTRRAQPESFIYTYVRSLSSYRKTPFKSRYNKKARSYPSGCLPPRRGKGPTGYDRVLFRSVYLRRNTGMPNAELPAISVASTLAHFIPAGKSKWKVSLP